ncbi:hypothetical protein HG536_0A03690 [Torulaspora globosa]|uniref:RNA binding protein She2 domain-containing protein n=1 Tax=Torulaspora globosa TaxID=48254 RepID=A0A7G3ZAL5_9SACH|nr:uncharacterized protein HG536_0A03690 [Torulaspora globosa]QLL30551.1 hypothetical protein HG536_0A03690 [Torulaspora globosa]
MEFIPVIPLSDPVAAIVLCRQDISRMFTRYMSNYVHFLNKFIGHMRRVGSLRFERMTLIKFVKKLRFLHESLTNFEVGSGIIHPEDADLKTANVPLASFCLKCLELLDVLNFYLTQPLQKEIISKTLNSNLTLSEDCIAGIEDTYNHFVKYTQWTIEALGIDDPLLHIEVVQFARKCALEDNVNVEESSDIFLQEVETVEDAEEYGNLSMEWTNVLGSKLDTLQVYYDDVMMHWQDGFDRKKDTKTSRT